MLDVETPTPTPTDERRNGPKRVMLGVLAAAAAVIAIAVVAARKDEPVNSVDQPSSTVTVPSTAPHPLVGAWLVDETPYVHVIPSDNACCFHSSAIFFFFFCLAERIARMRAGMWRTKASSKSR